MARIFRQHYTKKAPNGGRVKRLSRKWYVEFVNAHGVRRRVSGFGDKQATQQLAAELERKADREQSGLVDRFAEHCKRPLTEHLDDWHTTLLAKGTTAAHAKLVTRRARRVFEGCRFTYWSDLSASKVQTYVGDLQDRGASVQTCNFYLQAVKQFGRWMVQDGRAPDSPLAHLKGGNVRIDRRHDRRAFTDDELRTLLDTTRNGPTRFRMTGPERAVLYQLAAETGLRASELRSLTWASFDLVSSTPLVIVKAAYSKHRRDDTLPLKESSAEMLVHLRDALGAMDQEAVFAVMPEKLAKMLRVDLTDAGVAYRDDAGHVVDFHALRHTYITNLARAGVHPKVAQQLARHSTITLTMDRYSHLVIGDLSNALHALPDLSPQTPERQRATGTCDIAPKSLPTGLPKSLPNCLPTQVASQPSPVASHCTMASSDTDPAPQGDAGKTGVCCTSTHRVASHDTDVSQLRPAGFEPATPGLGNRCVAVSTNPKSACWWRQGVSGCAQTCPTVDNAATVPATVWGWVFRTVWRGLI